MFESAVAMITSQQPRMAALPAKQRPDVDAHQRHQAAQCTEQGEGHAVETGDAAAIGVARTAAASLGEEDDRQAKALGQLEQAVLLAVVLQPLGAGQHRVVVGHHEVVGAGR